MDEKERREKFGRQHPHYEGPERRESNRRSSDEEVVEKLNNAAKIGSTVHKLLMLSIAILAAISGVAIAANQVYKNAMSVPDIEKRLSSMERSLAQSNRDTTREMSSLRGEVKALSGDLQKYVSESDQDRREYLKISQEILRRLPLPPEVRYEGPKKPTK